MALAKLVSDPSVKVRQSAIRALAMYANWRYAAAQKALIQLATDKTADPSDRLDATDALGYAVRFQVKGVRQDPPMFQALVALLQEKVNYFENSPAIRDAYGQLLVQAGRYGDAVDMFRQASVLAEDDLTLRERFGLALYYDKQYVEAADVLGKLLEKDDFKDRADLLAALGQAQLQTGKPRDARRSFETATEKDPSSSKIWLGLARAAMEANDFKRSELALRKAHSLEPKASEAYLLHGYLRIKQDRMKDALVSFERASSLDPTDTVSVCMIGYVYEKTGRQDKAMEYYGKALKIKPNDPLASRLMAGIDLHE